MRPDMGQARKLPRAHHEDAAGRARERAAPRSDSGYLEGRILVDQSPRRNDLRPHKGSLVVKYSKSLNIQDVVDLGIALLEVADKYPTRYLTERDFAPLVIAYLKGRVPKIQTEVSTTGGDIDFRVGGTNPALLELAVAPRALKDSCAPDVAFPGHGKATQLYATQNKSELKKLLAITQAQAKGRFLLLLDLMDAHTKDRLKELYAAEAVKLPSIRPARIVYVSRNKTFHFSVPSKKRAA